MDTQPDRETVDMWPERDEERELNERLRAGGVRLATRSLDRTRVVVKPRPAWFAFLLTLMRARA